MDKDKIVALGKLARIDIEDAEAESLAHEFEGILNYVSEVKSAEGSISTESEKPALRNVFRDDEHQHESGEYTEALLEEAPAREGQYIKVKKIL